MTDTQTGSRTGRFSPGFFGEFQAAVQRRPARAGERRFFLHYVGRATGSDGPIEIRGTDRVRTRDGVVVENVIRYDPLYV